METKGRPNRHQYSNERGASTVEYAGVAVLVAVIIAGLVMMPWASSVAPQVRDTLQQAICAVGSHLPGGGDCAGDELASDEEQIEFPSCELGSSSQRTGSEITVLVVDLGDGSELRVSNDSDGNYWVTPLAYTDGGVNFKLIEGKFGEMVDVHAGVGAEGEYLHGPSYQFDGENAEEEALSYANEVEDWLGSNWQYMPFSGYFRDPPEPDVQQQREIREVDIDLFAQGTAELEGSWGSDDGLDAGLGDDDGGSFTSSILPSLSANARIGAEGVTVTDFGEDPHDPAQHSNSMTFTYNAGLEADALGLTEGELSGDMAFTVDFDNDDNLTGLQIKAGGTQSGADSADTETTVYTVDIPVDTDEAAAAVEEFLANLGEEDADPMDLFPDTLDEAAEGIPAFNDEGGVDAGVLDPVMDHVTVSREEFEGFSTDDSFGVKLKILSVGGGYSTVNESSEEELVNAQILGPPDQDGYQYWIDNIDCMAAAG